ncbi:MAG: hypothetical protein K2O15_03825, partial [Lachnospiraceae bacterium]|nr:hypothetical protein [Lachnospiraceae bacterium]
LPLFLCGQRARFLFTIYLTAFLRRNQGKRTEEAAFLVDFFCIRGQTSHMLQKGAGGAAFSPIVSIAFQPRVIP